MPVYRDSGTKGRFKANKGAGSVCTMVKSLVKGINAGFGDDDLDDKPKIVHEIFHPLTQHHPDGSKTIHHHGGLSVHIPKLHKIVEKPVIWRHHKIVEKPVIW